MIDQADEPLVRQRLSRHGNMTERQEMARRPAILDDRLFEWSSALQHIDEADTLADPEARNERRPLQITIDREDPAAP